MAATAGLKVWAAVMLASLAAIAWALWPTPAPRPPEPAPLLRLFDDAPRPAEIEAFEIARDGRVARRERGAGWDADTAARLRLLLGARLERAGELRGVDRERYGLGSPSLRIRVFTRNARTHALALGVGDLAPDELSYYVEANPGARVAKLPAYQIDNLLEMGVD